MAAWPSEGGSHVFAISQRGSVGVIAGEDAKPDDLVVGDDHVKPVIVITTDEECVNDQAINALAKRPNVFQRGGALVQVAVDAPPPPGISRPAGTPRIQAIRKPSLRERFEARGLWPGIPIIEAISEVPLLRADGTILDEPGFDLSTGILFLPKTNSPPVPPSPTAADIGQAVFDLNEVVCDFPFRAETIKKWHKEFNDSWDNPKKKIPKGYISPNNSNS